MRIAQMRVYQFDELSEKAKEEALQKLRDINVDYDWWEPYYEGFREELRKIGIEAEDFGFDLGRGAYLYINKGYFTDEERFLKLAGVDLRRREAKDALQYGIELCTKHLGGGDAYNYCDPNNLEDVNICEYLKDVLRGFWEELRCAYNYLISDEAVIETIEANEYEFTEQGELFQLKEMSNV